MFQISIDTTKEVVSRKGKAFRETTDYSKEKSTPIHFGKVFFIYSYIKKFYLALSPILFPYPVSKKGG